jgi:DNA invertase Pin-like site-specific DNA recombinase
MAAKPKAYSYVRFSTPAQLQGDSLRRQLELSRKYAEEHDLELIAASFMRDLGKSAFDGTNIEKGGLGMFLQAAKDGLIEHGSYLLVESLDRISRAQVRKANKLFNEIIDCGITIVTLADGMVFSPDRMDGDDAGIAIILSILTMMRAHEESARKSQRVREAWQNKQLRAGEEKLTRTCPQWMRLYDDRKDFVLIPEAVEVVRRIIDMHMNGMGQSTIVKILNQEGVPTLTYLHKRAGSVGWHESVIQKISTSTALYGEYQPATGQGKKRIPFGDPIPDYYPALITKEEFIALQQVRQERATRGRGIKGEGFANIFSGLLYCGYCGSKIRTIGHVSRTEKRTKRSVVCATAKRGLGCHFLMWSYPNFEATVLTYLQGVDFAGLLDDAKSVNKRIVALSAKIEALRQEFADSEGKLDRLYDALESGSTLASLQERIERQEQRRFDIVDEIKAKEHELLSVQALLTDASKIKASVLELCTKMGSLTGDGLYQLRAQLATQIRRVVDRINVFGGGYLMPEADYQAMLDTQLKDWELEDDYRWMITPEKSRRYVQIVGKNGKKYHTYNALDAKLKDMPEKMEILQRLGFGVEFDIKMRDQDAAATMPKTTKAKRSRSKATTPSGTADLT